MDLSNQLKEMKRNLSVLSISVFCFGFAAPASATLVSIEPDNFAAGQDISLATPGAKLSSMTMTPAGVDSNGHPVFSPVYGSVFAQTMASPCIAQFIPLACTFTGSNLFAHTSNAGPVYTPDTWGEAEVAAECTAGCHTTSAEQISAILRVDFDTPTDYVDVVATLWSGDGSWLQAFDSYGNILDSCYGIPGWTTGTNPAGFTCGVTPELLSSSQSIYGWYRYSISAPTADISYVLIGGYGNDRALDLLRFNSASVPEPEAFGLFALALLGFAFKRRGRAQESEAVF